MRRLFYLAAAIVALAPRPGAAGGEEMLSGLLAEGYEITTVEGMAHPDGTLDPIQMGFHECHALQCGFCTPGMMLTSVAFLKDNPSPTDEEIRWALSGQLCRCTGYQNIVNAVQAAATTMREA